MRAHMRILDPEYVADARLGDDILGLVRFGASTGVSGGELSIAIRPAARECVEIWRSAAPVVRGLRHGIAFAQNGHALFGTITTDDDEPQTAARGAYESIVALTRDEGFPFILRAWNHVRAINSGDGDRERYKRFSAGRHEALTAAGFEKRQFPAASAVGMEEGELAVYFIASRTPGRQIENPRQVSAYDYPRQYGVRAPSFSRATAASMNGSSLVFVSGTASVVGHETAHAGDLEAQTEETIRNLGRILCESGAAPAEVRTLKLYVRRAEDATVIVPRLRDAFGSAAVLVLETEICRRDLLLEVEAVAIG